MFALRARCFLVSVVFFYNPTLCFLGNLFLMSASSFNQPMSCLAMYCCVYVLFC
jgi:hypothetical protein